MSIIGLNTTKKANAFSGEQAPLPIIEISTTIVARLKPLAPLRRVHQRAWV